MKKIMFGNSLMLLGIHDSSASAFVMALGNCFENGRDWDCHCNGL